MQQKLEIIINMYFFIHIFADMDSFERFVLSTK